MFNLFESVYDNDFSPINSLHFLNFYENSFCYLLEYDDLSKVVVSDNYISTVNGVTIF